MNKKRTLLTLFLVIAVCVGFALIPVFAQNEAIPAQTESDVQAQAEINAAEALSAQNEAVPAQTGTDVQAQPGVNAIEGLSAQNGGYTAVLVPADDAARQRVETYIAENGVPELTLAEADAASPEGQQVLAALPQPEENAQVLSEHVYELSLTHDGVPVAIDGVSVAIAPDQEFVQQGLAQVVVQDENTALTVQTAGVNAQGEAVQAGSGYTVQSVETPVETSIAPNQVFAVRATVNNPNFTVQYYVNKTQTLTGSGDNSVPVIDSSKKGYVTVHNSQTNPAGTGDGKGGVLPENGNENPKKVNLALEQIGTSKNYQLKTDKKLQKFYKQETFTYFTAPNPNYFNKLLTNGNFTLSEIWILKSGKSADSNNRNDWTIKGADAKFTNNKDYAASHKDVVLIKNNDVLRMVYEEVNGSHTEPTNFYDYNIMNGGKLVTNTSNNTYPGNNTYGNWGQSYGINSNKNYSNATAKTKLAFGNVNTGTHLGKVTWNGNKPNMYNGSTYKGCTFGLAAGLNADGTIKYASGIIAPKLFNEGSATGKKTFSAGSNNQLTFDRRGDTYVLTAAKVNGTKSVSNLNRFNHPGNATTTYTHIWTNNFWPMDKLSYDGMDPQTGDGYLPEVSGWKWTNGEASNYTGSYAKVKYPQTDDFKKHNQLFGMHYTVDFKLAKDYVGPLDYLFFGDDDMWVFLDGKPVMDIGGVHSSVGQYVNLWDYIKKDSTKDTNHRLTFFYTERGLSGSTCYMQFTLPEVSVANPQLDTGNIIIKKEADAELAASDKDKEYTFNIHLTDAKGNNLPDEYAYTKYDSETDTPIAGSTNIVLRDGTDFTLKAGQYAKVDYVPVGSKFTVKETDTGNATQVTVGNTVYHPVIESGNVPAVTGTVSKAGTDVIYTFKNEKPTTELSFQKTVTYPDGNPVPSGALIDQTYTFRVLKADGTVLYPAGTPYTVRETDKKDTAATVGPNDLITLRRGQTAVFKVSRYDTPQNYYVQELIPADRSAVYGDVYVNGTLTGPQGPVEIAGITYTAYNGPMISTDAPANSAFAWDNRLKIQAALWKVDPEGHLITTTNATFKLYCSVKPDAADKDIETETSSDATYYRLKKEPVLTTAEGRVNLTNLLPGAEYLLKETGAPDGYALLKDPILFSIDAAGTLTLKGDAGGMAQQVPEEPVFTIRVTNTAGAVLPDAGGFGTTGFIVGGLVLIMGAGALYWGYRRKNNPSR